MKKSPVLNVLFYGFLLACLAFCGYLVRSRFLLQTHPWPQARLARSGAVTWYHAVDTGLQGVENWSGRVLTRDGSFYMHEWPDRKELSIVDLQGRVVVYFGWYWRMQDSVVLESGQQYHLVNTTAEITALDSVTLARRTSTHLPRFSTRGWTLGDLAWYLREAYPISGCSLDKDMDSSHIYIPSVDSLYREEPLDSIIGRLQKDSIGVKKEGTSLVFSILPYRGP
jgi:hypothetical protein